MTTDSNARPGPADFREGIYLEKKKGGIGTGGTAKTAEYRSFWATGRLTAGSAVMILLDDGFMPTAIVETFSLETLSGANWFYVAEGEKKYQQLRPSLDRLLAAQDQKAAADSAAAHAHKAEPAPANWWGGAAPEGPPANPFELKKDKKDKKMPQVKKGGWWEK